MKARLLACILVLLSRGLSGMQAQVICGNYHLCIRPLVSDDYGCGYLQLLEQLTHVDAERITFEQFGAFVRSLSADHIVVVAEDELCTRVVAAATLFIEHKCIHCMGSVGHIEDVVVDSRLRGVGLGRIMVDHLVTYARSRNCYKVILDCSPGNVPFYEKCGFTAHAVEMAQYF